MDVFQLLKQDHDQVKQQIEEALSLCEEQEEPDERLSGLLEQLVLALRIHAKLEEQYLYPRAEKISRLKELVEDSLEEHGEVKLLLKKIEDHMEEVPELQKYLEQLKIGIEHHVQEEEGTMFPTLRNELDKDTINKMTEEASAFKQEQLSEQK